MSSTQQPRARAQAIGVLVAGVGLFSVLGIAIFGAVQSPTSAQAEQDNTGVNASGALSAANRATTPDDEFPVSGTSDPVQTGVIPETSRLLGQTDVARYWVARATAPGKDLCLVTELIGSFTSLSCGSTDEFLTHGIGNQSVGNESASRAYLVPDGTEAEGEREGAIASFPNLLVFDAEVDGNPIRLTRVTGAALEESTVELRPFEAADRNF